MYASLSSIICVKLRHVENSESNSGNGCSFVSCLFPKDYTGFPCTREGLDWFGIGLTRLNLGLIVHRTNTHTFFGLFLTVFFPFACFPLFWLLPFLASRGFCDTLFPVKFWCIKTTQCHFPEHETFVVGLTTFLVKRLKCVKSVTRTWSQEGLKTKEGRIVNEIQGPF